MPKQPTLLDVGALTRRTIAGDRPVATYSVDDYGKAGEALAKSGQTLGAGIEKDADALHAVSLADDQDEVTGANSQFQVGKLGLESQLAQDQNYPDLQQRYTDQVTQLRDSAAASISNPRMRAVFEAKTDPEIARGQAAFADKAWRLEGGQKIADLDALGTTLAQSAADHPDQATRSNALDTYNSRADALASKGWLGPEQSLATKQRFAEQYSNANADARIERGDAIGVLNDMRAAPTTPDQVTDRIMRAEGTSKNPNSSATGTGQFINSTWLATVKKNRPDLAAGKSDAEILALRADTSLGRDMTAAYASDNAATLRAHSVEATPGNTYLAHFLGPGAAVAVAKADPNRPVIDVLSDAVGPDQARRMVDANRSVLQGKLAGSVTQWSNNLMGGASDRSIYQFLPAAAQDRIRQRAESALADHRNRADAEAKLDEYNLKGTIKDDLASMEATGRGLDTVPDDRIRTVLGGAAYQKYQDDRNDKHTTWLATHDFATLPEPAIQARLDAIEPQPGAPGYERAQKIWSDAKDKAADVLKARRDDPAGSITDDPAVKDALAQYDPQQPETFKPVAQARMAAQDRAGLDDEYRSPITKDEALKLTAPLRTMLPGQERDTLTQIGQKFQQMFGDDAEAAFSYALRAHKVDAATSQMAARVMRKLNLGASPTPGEAQQLDDAKETDAAERAVTGPSWFERMLNTGAAPELSASGAAIGVPDYSGPAAAPKSSGPELPAIKPRAIQYLLANPGTAAAFDKEFAQPGLAKQILEKYSAAAANPGTTVRGAP